MSGAKLGWRSDGRLYWKEDFPFSAPALHSFKVMTERTTKRIAIVVVVKITKPDQELTF